jgi:nucleotidyltransferase substrate binding protein (TIGR01987 family)
MTKLDALKNQYQKAVKRLDEILKEEKSDIVRDSAIKRFEFTFDLSWKLLKTYLEEEKGVSCQSPKECFREAFRQGLIDYDEFWLKITDLRNQAVHTYGEKFAESLYRELPEILKYFQLLLKKIS